MATRRGVVYELDADEQKAIDGFRRAIGKAKQMEAAVTSGSSKMTRAYGRQGRELRGIEQAFGRIQRMGRNMLGGLGVGSAGMVGAMVLRNSVRELQNQAKLQETFEGEITGVLSLGSNVEHITAVKQEVLDLSNAWNRPRAEMAAFMFNLQSNASNVSEEIRGGIKKESLELAKVTGATLPTAVNIMTKAWQAYGDELEDVNDLQNKLFLIAERGAITFEELGQFAPDLFQTAKVLGYSLPEVGAAIITATQKLGGAGKALTAVRNVLTRIGDAPEKLEGFDIEFKLTGDLVEDLKALESLDPQILKKLFGEEALAGAAALASATEDLIENIELLQKVEGDLAADREKERLKDPAYVMSESSKVLEEMNKNLPLEGGMTESAQRKTQEFKQAMLGARMELPEHLQWQAKPRAYIDVGLERLGEGINWALTGEKFEDRLTNMQSKGAMAEVRLLIEQGRLGLARKTLDSLPPNADHTWKKVGAGVQRRRREVDEAVSAAHELMPEVPKFLHRLGVIKAATDASPLGRRVEGFNRKVKGKLEGKLEARAERREEGRLDEQERRAMVRAQVKLGHEPSFAGGPAASGAAAFGKSVVGAVLKPFEGPLEEFRRGFKGISDVGSLLFGIPDPATAGKDFGRLSGMDRQGGGAGVGRDEERRIVGELRVELRAIRGGDRGEDSGMQSGMDRQGLDGDAGVYHDEERRAWRAAKAQRQIQELRAAYAPEAPGARDVGRSRVPLTEEQLEVKWDQLMRRMEAAEERRAAGTQQTADNMQRASEQFLEAAKELAAANKGPRGVRGREMTPRADASSAFAEVSEAG